MKNYLVILTILFLTSCCKPVIEEQTLYHNTTDKKIELRAYNKGLFNTSFIEPNVTTMAYFVSAERGIAVDSILLFIDNKLSETHYSVSIKKPVAANSIFGFEDPKNLINFANYQKTVEQLSCNGRITKLVYTF